MMRYHPLTMLYRLFHLLKNSLFIIIILFVVNHDSDMWMMKYGRYIFIVVIIMMIFNIIVSWFVEKYEWKEKVFYIHKGIFVKETSTIPFSRIQNITRKTEIFHKIFGLTSLTFETAMDGLDDSIHFKVITKKHADELIDLIKVEKDIVSENDETNELNDGEMIEQVNTKNTKLTKERTLHFTPRQKDLWKASFTSLSFLAIIPIIAGGFEYVQPFLEDRYELEGVVQTFLDSSWIIGVVITFAVIISVCFGIATTFIRYGKYEISSDTTHIYIERGVLNESYFSIEKNKIQGLEIQQTVLKRLFGLAEVKIISSAKAGEEDGKVNVNSLYPFLPLQEAYELIEEILPNYQIHDQLEKLPRVALFLKLIRPSWFWLLATVALIYFKPSFLFLSWWALSLILLFIIVINRVLDYFHTRYILEGDQVQWWKGGLTSRMFITKRKNVVEMSYSQSRLQKRFQVSSVTTINRSTPIHMETIQDIPLPYALSIQDWYYKRSEDVEVI
ncbi:PH domain-containing protein [Ornithinibacillus halotolerans]|uniref:YdbS-like PH domain-containing protein n=1 Tax=Ornithinibacillus halotolerans TaxID=1274357 RepID=A0A916W2D1_9BACI|nr:PH domain-containing protein [Ornithinibacillus halotolerans]GGA60669.1 hypothetical protein GCM10008025_00880 [Ornithinibacillus halotolerans]